MRGELEQLELVGLALGKVRVSRNLLLGKASKFLRLVYKTVDTQKTAFGHVARRHARSYPRL